MRDPTGSQGPAPEAGLRGDGRGDLIRVDGSTYTFPSALSAAAIGLSSRRESRGVTNQALGMTTKLWTKPSIKYEHAMSL